MQRSFVKHSYRLGLTWPWFAAVLLPLALVIALPDTAGAQCGTEVQVAEGDTLSSIAERCDVTEAKILDLNPGIEGSNDLRAGMMLNLEAPSGGEAAAKAREAARNAFDRLWSYAQEAGETIEGAAEQVTGSIQDFLARNPNLHQRVRKLGQRLNIPGMEDAGPEISMSVSKGTPGTAVTLSAIGLPANQRVAIAGGAPESDYDILEYARTSSDGTLQVTVELPQWADPEREFIFVLAIPQHDVAARSASFDVLATTGRAPAQQ